MDLTQPIGVAISNAVALRPCRRRGAIAPPELDEIDEQFCKGLVDDARIAMFDALGVDYDVPSPEQHRNSCVGFVLLKYDGVYRNAMQSFGPERSYLALHFVGYNQKMVRFIVEDAVALRTPQPLVGEGCSIYASNSTSFRVTPECYERLLDALAQNNAPARDTLDAWKASGYCSVDMEFTTMLQLPHPISYLVAMGWWEELSLDCRLRRQTDSILRVVLVEARKHVHADEVNKNNLKRNI